MDADVLSRIIDARRSRKAVAVVTDISSGKQLLFAPQDLPAGEMGQEIDNRLKSGKSGIVTIDEEEKFVQVYVPSPRLVIIGAVHISQALVPMAKACEFDVVIIDPRTAFASAERFPGVEMLADWPDEFLKSRPLDPYTALVALTHDPKIDDLPLKTAISSGCFYIGALGSRKTHGKRIERLAQSGIGREDVKKIHAPIGVDIGAASPAEIAVSIMAEIILSLRRE